ncbi:cytosolic non-specific dipeptidase-like [Phymastichus coffea]|uniref:cytosolic non-specific dipeptidase-like n=1 Tax=Phymastichus coffea TaxID=108790 RepID=UPI00273CA818|nr:cytosolic non-specific dipeptidase-like [Phymastichus coffea]
MPIPPDLVKCYKYLDLNSQNHIEELRKLVNVPNVSADPYAKDHLSALVRWISKRLKNLGFNLVTKIPDYKNYKGNKPPVVVGILGKDPEKTTLLYYCHLDVLKVQKAQWKTDPFELTEIDGKLYGRGTAKMKGPLLCFIHAIEAYREVGVELPINIRIICESMFECKNKGLNSVLEDLKPTFLTQVDCIMMMESRWLGKDYPCIVYGMRGVCYFNCTIEGPKNDLHSGDFGGIIREPMQDLIFILNSLADAFGHVNVPHFYDDVVEVTPDEESLKKKIKLDVEDYRKDVGVDTLGHNNNLKLVLMHTWRYPWFNLHYINNSCENSNILDIPKKVFARFSVRTVPNQRHEKVSNSLVAYVKELEQQLKTPNKIEINADMSLDPWCENHLHWNYEAASVAIKQVYKEEASFIREGNGFPTLLKLRDAMPKLNILMLPIVNNEAKAHTEEENISIRCYIEGAKVLASYFYELPTARLRSTLRKKIGKLNVCRDKL